MRNNTFLPMLLVAVVWLWLPSCNSSTDNNPTFKAPDTAQPGAPGGAEKAPKEGEASDQMPDKNVATATIANLIAAYTGETTASAKYAAYSKKAQEEGFTQIALLFKTTSMSEKVHADNHRAVLEDMGEAVPEVKPQYSVKTTAENLTDAISGESYEISTMYPEFIAIADKADNQLARTSFNYAYRTEQRHKALYEKAQTALQAKQLNTLSSVYYMCPTCGNTYDSTPPKRCRISMTSSDLFIKINAL